MYSIDIKYIDIDAHRQRRSATQVIELAESIAKNGLLHPVVVRTLRLNGSIEARSDDRYALVAGERRLRAIEHLWATGGEVRCNGRVYPEGFVPCTTLGDLDPLDAFEAELEENIRRVDLTWQERATATSQLYELRKLQARKVGDDVSVSVAEIADELQQDDTTTRAEILVARHLDDPDIAKASTAKDALKILKRREGEQRSRELGERIGRTFSAADHTLLQGDCLEIMKGLKDESFDCILTDPPYGINAQDFNDSGGKAHAVGHTYDDSFDNWRSLMRVFSAESYRLAKPQAHGYIFCDVDNFLLLRTIMGDEGWNCFRTPIIWHNPSSQRAPWPQHGPLRRYQMCLYATKGDRPTLKLAPDLVTYASDENLGWAAQKPVALYMDLLSRTCRPGDTALDCFVGSGTIFPSCHALRIKATGIEMDPVAYGIALKRLKDLG